jgi:hypothetical protein
MKTKMTLVALFVSGFIMTTIFSCQKGIEQNNGTQQLNVYLTDDPVRLNAVNLDIVSIEAKVDSTEFRNDDHHGDHDMDMDDHNDPNDEFGYWTNLNFTPGIYNVLQLRNGIDSMIASGIVNGTVRKLRIKIGTNNSVLDTNNISYPLVLANPDDSLIYIHLFDNHRSHHDHNNTSVWIDFDLGHSIQYVNGQYILSPSVRPFCDDNFGEIEGRVLPDSAHAVVMVYNSTDTTYAYPFADGRFKIRGLNPGSYNVLFDAQPPYQDSLMSNISVSTGYEVELRDVILHR